MSTQFKNTPNDPNFDLDEYIRQKSEEGDDFSFQPPEQEAPEGSTFKNALLIVSVFMAAFLWYHDWSPAQAWNSVFGSNQQTVAVNIPDININIPEINIPSRF